MSRTAIAVVEPSVSTVELEPQIKVRAVRPVRRTQPRFPAEPLIGRFIDIDTAAEVFHVTTRTIHRWVERGLGLDDAEDRALDAGYHPAEIWGWPFVQACLDMMYDDDELCSE